MFAAWFRPRQEDAGFIQLIGHLIRSRLTDPSTNIGSWGYGFAIPCSALPLLSSSPEVSSFSSFRCGLKYHLSVNSIVASEFIVGGGIDVDHLDSLMLWQNISHFPCRCKQGKNKQQYLLYEANIFSNSEEE